MTVDKRVVKIYMYDFSLYAKERNEMIICKICKKVYDEKIERIFELSGISLENMCCCDCKTATLVRTTNKSHKEN